MSLVTKETKETQEEFSFMLDYPKCKHENVWFDRTISYDSDGKEYGMSVICSDCKAELD